MARNKAKGLAIHQIPRALSKIGATGFAKILLAIMLLLLPVLYDRAVPDAARDIRGVWVMQGVLICVAVLVVGWILSARNRILLDFPIAVYLVLVLAVLAILSCIDTIHPWRSWFYLKFFLGYCGLFALVYALRGDRWYEVLSWMLVLPLLLNGFLILCQVHGFSDRVMAEFLPIWKQIGFIDHFRQAIPPAGSFSNKNLVASWIVLILPLCLYHFINSKNNWITLLASSLLAMGLLSLFYTHSRASWIAATGSFLFLAIWLVMHRAYWRILKRGITSLKLMIGSLLVFSAGISMTIMLASGGSGIMRSMSKKTEGLISLLLGDWGALGERLALTLNGARILKDYPFNGTGIGTFHTIYPYYQNATQGLPASTRFALSVRPERAHNDLLQMMIEMGVLSGLMLTGLFVMMIVMGRRLSKEEVVEKAGLLPVFLLTGIVGMALNALGDFPLQMPTAAALLFAMMAMMTGKYALHAQWNRSGRSIELPSFAPIATLLVLLIGIAFVFYDNDRRREGAKPLKAAGYLTMTGQFNDKNMNLLELSHKTYPWNSRLMEFRCVTYANYRGSRKISLETRLSALEDCLKYDKYNVVTLVNLGSSYYEQAIKFLIQGNRKKVPYYTKKIHEIAKTLHRIVPHALQGQALSGMAHLAAGDLNMAKVMFKGALKENSRFSTAKAGLETVKLLSQGMSFAEIRSTKTGKEMGITMTLNAQGKRAIPRRNR